MTLKLENPLLISTLEKLTQKGFWERRKLNHPRRTLPQAFERASLKDQLCFLQGVDAISTYKTQKFLKAKKRYMENALSLIVKASAPEAKPFIKNVKTKELPELIVCLDEFKKGYPGIDFDAIRERIFTAVLTPLTAKIEKEPLCDFDGSIPRFFSRVIEKGSAEDRDKLVNYLSNYLSPFKDGVDCDHIFNTNLLVPFINAVNLLGKIKLPRALAGSLVKEGGPLSALTQDLSSTNIVNVMIKRLGLNNGPKTAEFTTHLKDFEILTRCEACLPMLAPHRNGVLIEMFDAFDQLLTPWYENAPDAQQSIDSMLPHIKTLLDLVKLDSSSILFEPLVQHLLKIAKPFDEGLALAMTGGTFDMTLQAYSKTSAAYRTLIALDYPEEMIPALEEGSLLFRSCRGDEIQYSVHNRSKMSTGSAVVFVDNVAFDDGADERLSIDSAYGSLKGKNAVAPDIMEEAVSEDDEGCAESDVQASPDDEGVHLVASNLV